MRVPAPSSSILPPAGREQTQDPPAPPSSSAQPCGLKRAAQGLAPWQHRASFLSRSSLLAVSALQTPVPSSSAALAVAADEVQPGTPLLSALVYLIFLPKSVISEFAATLPTHTVPLSLPMPLTFPGHLIRPTYSSPRPHLSPYSLSPTPILFPVPCLCCLLDPHLGTRLSPCQGQVTLVRGP